MGEMRRGGDASPFAGAKGIRSPLSMGENMEFEVAVAADVIFVFMIC